MATTVVMATLFPWHHSDVCCQVRKVFGCGFLLVSKLWIHKLNIHSLIKIKCKKVLFQKCEKVQVHEYKLQTNKNTLIFFMKQSLTKQQQKEKQSRELEMKPSDWLRRCLF